MYEYHFSFEDLEFNQCERNYLHSSHNVIEIYSQLVFGSFSVDELVLNVDLAPTFLDMGGVPTPTHMDGHSILPLLLNKHKYVREQWPDTFLIESSGRRETAEQIAESRIRLQIERTNMKLVNSTFIEDFLPEGNFSTTSAHSALLDGVDLGSREEDEQDRTG